MTKLIARLGLFGSQMAVGLANWWFTFGLWPKSWTSFVVCGAATIAIMTIGFVIEMEGA